TGGGKATTRRLAGIAAINPPSAITAPPTHNHVTPGLRKNRNVARCPPSPSKPMTDEYRSLSTPKRIDGVPMGSLAAGYRLSDGVSRPRERPSRDALTSATNTCRWG